MTHNRLEKKVNFYCSLKMSGSNNSEVPLTLVDLGHEDINKTFEAGESVPPLLDGVNNISLVIPTGMPMPEAVLSSVLLFIFTIFTIVGNILVILSVFTYRPLRNVQNFFIVSLAVADISVAAFVMPFNVINTIMGYWVFGNVFCDMWLTCDILCCTSSILNLCAIATDRYFAIHDPINYAQKRTMKRVLLMIALVWGASAIISIPPLIGWNNWNDRSSEYMTCQLTSEQGYVIYSASGSFYIPLFIMAFVYIKIFLATRRRLRERAKRTAAAMNVGVSKSEYSVNTNNKTFTTTIGMAEATVEHAEHSSSDTPDDIMAVEDSCVLSKQNSGSSHTASPKHHNNHHDDSKTPLTGGGKSNGKSKQKQSLVSQFLEEKQKISLSKERRAARTLGIIMGVFVLSWLPFFLMYVILPFCDSCVLPDERVVNFIVWLGYLNSGLNPIIYTIFNIDFRRAFKRLLTGRR